MEGLLTTNINILSSTAPVEISEILNPRLSYYYFRFVKTDVRHIAILLSVSTLTYSSSWLWHFASANQISSKSFDARRSYDVTMLIQIGGLRVGNLFPASVLVTALV